MNPLKKKYMPLIETGLLYRAAVVNSEIHEIVWASMGMYMSYENALAAAEGKICRLLAQDELIAAGEHASAALLAFP